MGNLQATNMCCVSTENDNNFEIEKPIISIRRDNQNQKRNELETRSDESFI